MTKSISLTNDELEIIIRVIAVPLGAFGLNKLIQKSQLSEKECKRIDSFIESHRSKRKEIQLNINQSDVGLMSKIFDISAEIIDPQEMHTITGYTWDESMNVSKKLRSLAENS